MSGIAPLHGSLVSRRGLIYLVLVSSVILAGTCFIYVPETHFISLAIGLGAMLLLILQKRFLPNGQVRSLL